MGHIQDRWYKTLNDPATGKAVRVKSALCGSGLRFKVRYLDPDGNEKSRMYPDKCKKQAEDFLLEVESSKRQGKYVDPRAGRIKFRQHAENWIKGQSPDRATRGALQSRLDSQIYPHFGDLPINAIKSATVRDWLGTLEENKLSQNYRTVLFTTLSSIMDSAVEDRLITINPCKANSIRRPTSPSSNIAVWPEDRLRAVQDGLSARFRIICTVGAGCGLRQGEILGLSPDDIDEDGESLHVQRQVRVVDRTLVLALPKGGKKRRVPLSSGVLAAART
jgi:integrase